jgi:hypothetical protein
MTNPTNHLSSRQWETISAYLDGQLSPPEQARLESRLDHDRDLAAAVDDLRQVRSILRRQPKARAPRSFALTPAMVGRAKRPARRGPALGWFGTLRLSSALAAVMLVLVVIGDVFSGAPVLPAPDQAQVAMEAAPLMAPMAAGGEAEAPVAKGPPPPEDASAAADAAAPAAETRLMAPPGTPADAAVAAAPAGAPPLLPPRPTLRWIEIALAGLALGLGAAAFLIQRTHAP